MNAFKGTLYLLFSGMLCMTCSSADLTEYQPIQPNHPLIQITGRTDISDPAMVRFSHTGVTIKACFTGNTCLLKLRNQSFGDTSYKNFYTVLIDDEAPFVLVTRPSDSVFALPLKNRESHTITLFKRTESFIGNGIFGGLALEKGHKLLPLPDITRRIEFIGNSITCGYGNEGNAPTCHFSPASENGYMAYGALTARQLKAAYLAVAYSGKGVIQNYNLQDKEALPDIYDRIFPDKPEPLWQASRYVPDVVVINLGTNDFAHHVPDSVRFVTAYINLVSKLRNRYPQACIICLEGGMTRDGWPKGQASFTIVKRYIEAARQSFLIKGDKNVFSFFIPAAEINELGCDYHPNIRFHEKMALQLTTFIKKTTGWK